MGLPPMLSGITVWQPDQGLVLDVPPTQIPDRAAADTQNVVFFDGKIVVRPGFQVNTTLNPAVPTPTALISHLGKMVTQSQNYYLLRVEVQGTTATVYAFNTTGTGWEDITPATPVFASSDGSRPVSVQFKGEWLLALGGSNLHRWTGTGDLIDVTAAQASAALKAPSNPRVVCATNARVFLANAEIDGVRIPWRVWWSKSFDSAVWSNGAKLPEQANAGYGDCLGTDSSPIVAMAYHGNQHLLVWKRHSIFRSIFRGSPTWFEFQPITNSRGTSAPGSIQAYKDLMIWLGDDFNVYLMDINGQIKAIGDAIRPLLEDIFNPFYGFAVSSMVDVVRGLYWLFIPYDQNGATLNSILVLNLKTGAWSRGNLATTSLQMGSAIWYWPDPPYFTTKPLQLWGGSDGQIYGVDYDNPTMIDGDTKFTASWWGKVVDLLQLQKEAGKEQLEFQKAALHGLTGVAVPQVRMGKMLKDLDEELFLARFNAQDMDDVVGNPERSYVADRRVDPMRFGQFGIYWPLGIDNPGEVGGFTAWGLPRGMVR